MHKQWQDYLIDRGAVLDDGQVTHFGNPEAELKLALSADVLVDLSHIADLNINGEDAGTFLQGQLTNDIQEVNPQHCQLSGYCNPQGRLLALFRIFSDQDGYHLLLPRELLPTTMQRLKMFVLRSKVTVHDRSDDYIRIGISGARLSQALARQLPAVPETTDAVYHHQALTILRLAGAQPRYIVSGPCEVMCQLWDTLATDATAAGSAAWRLLDIRAGLPEVVTATSNLFIPQMLNLRELAAINFRKGCYTGQEIVARLQYRGTLKRRMYHARIDSVVQPAPGDPVHVRGESQSSGNLVSVVASPDGGFEALAVITVEHSDQPLCQGDANGAALQILAPPYPFAPLAKV